MKTKEDLAQLLRTWPMLGLSGFGITSDPVELLASWPRVKLILGWLERWLKEPVPWGFRARRFRNSYGIKHIVTSSLEEETPGEDGYVSNGEFIAAALLYGLEHEDEPRGPNMYFWLPDMRYTAQFRCSPHERDILRRRKK